jgi:hypothetical protein
MVTTESWQKFCGIGKFELNKSSLSQFSCNAISHSFGYFYRISIFQIPTPQQDILKEIQETLSTKVRYFVTKVW